MTHDVRNPNPTAKTQSFTVQYAGTNGSTAGVKLNELTYRVAAEGITAEEDNAVDGPGKVTTAWRMSQVNVRRRSHVPQTQTCLEILSASSKNPTTHVKVTRLLQVNFFIDASVVPRVQHSVTPCQGGAG